MACHTTSDTFLIDVPRFQRSTVVHTHTQPSRAGLRMFGAFGARVDRIFVGRRTSRYSHLTDFQ